jgi:type IV pilus assembly protein PilA
MMMAAPAKTAVAETLSSNGGTLADIDATKAGYSFPGATTYVSGITISGGLVTATVSANTGTSGTLVLKPSNVGSGQLVWTCDGAAGSTIPAKYLPSACR